MDESDVKAMLDKKIITLKTIKTELKQQNKLRLQFNHAGLERAYLNDVSKDYVRTDRWFLIIGMFIYTFCVLIDYYFFAPFFISLTIGRLAFVAVAIILLYLTFIKQVPSLASRSTTVSAVLQVGASATLCLNAMLCTFPSDFIYLFCMTPLMTGVLASLRQNFKKCLYSLLSMVIIQFSVLYVLTIKTPSYIQSEHIIWVYDYYIPAILMFTSVTAFVGLFMPYLVERTLRVDWLKTQIIAYESEDLKTLNQQLNNLSNMDDLTSIANRRKFIRCLSEDYEHIAGTGESLSLLMIDVDYFKNYNDTYGHGAGDECLKMIAHAMVKQCSGPADLVARYGGEEFMLLMPNAKKDEALHICDRLNQSVSALGISHKKSPLRKVTVSIGLVTFKYSPDVDVKQILKCVDDALYDAKSLGRNQTVYRDVVPSEDIM